MRPDSAAASRRLPGRSAGGGGASALRFPTSSARVTPSSVKRSARAIVLRKHEVEGREQRPAHAGTPPPALERGGRHAAVDEDKRDALRLGLEHEVRPDLGFDQHRQVGAPMVQEALHIALIVERHILVHRALGQPRARELRRRDGAGGEQEPHLGMIGGDAVDHRQRGIGLADARRMEPRKEPGRTRRARHAVALRPPVELLLAAARAPGEDQRRDRRGKLRERAVGLERQPRLDGVLLAVQRIARSGERDRRAPSPR